jgi:hypothetical protein
MIFLSSVLTALKALLAAGVSPDAYGRAFGFEGMMDKLF